MYIKRGLEGRIKELSSHFPVVLVTGARQVGKTTQLKKMAEGNEVIRYVTLDYPRIRQLAREDPELFLQQYPAPLIIDEIQYATELLTYIVIRKYAALCRYLQGAAFYARKFSAKGQEIRKMCIHWALCLKTKENTPSG